MYTIKTFKNKEKNATNKANIKINFGNCFEVTGIHIREGEKGLFITMPQYKIKDGEYKNIANPTTADFRNELYNDILSSYNYLNKNDERSSFIKEGETKEPTSYKVSIYKTKDPQNMTKAMASININDKFAINNIQIKEGQHGQFVSMPSIKTDSGYIALAAPTENYKKNFNDNIISAYSDMVKNNLDSISKEFFAESPSQSNGINDYVQSMQQAAPSSKMEPEI